MSTQALRGGPTAVLTAYATRFTFSDLPAAAVEEAKTIVLDTLGALLLGSAPQYTASWLTGELARRAGGAPECTVIGRDFKTSCESAALANGTMGYAADIEGASVSRQHVPAVLVPVALAVGERERADGKAFLASLAVGYEICSRAGEACRTEHSYPHSFHPSAVFGYFGAAATAGHLLRLTQPQFANALGIAGSNASGLMTWVDDPTENSRPLVIGMAARGGVTAALLAQMGFGGPPAILDGGKYSIYDAYAGEMHLDRLTDALGEVLWITRTYGYKRHPCCGDIHTGVDALLSILDEHRITADDVAAIVHRVKADRAPVIDNNPLKSHCAQYIMAVAAVRRKIDSGDILEDRRRADPRIRSLVERVRLIGDPAMDAWTAHAPAVVEVTTRDGRTLTARVDEATGRRENPMTKAELEQKFMDLATTRISRSAAARLMELVYGLDRVADVGELAALLRVAPR
jgi:2-methylcitrate dehydratase PrpD